MYAESEIEVYYYYYRGCYCLHSGSDVALGCHSDDMIFAKLCDFSHAVSMEDELSEEDEEDIRQLLLPAILPPEVEITCNCIGVNRPAIVREIPHFGLFPAFPHFCQNVPHFWLYFEITNIAENRNNFSCTETFCSKKLCENVRDSY